MKNKRQTIKIAVLALVIISTVLGSITMAFADTVDKIDESIAEAFEGDIANVKSLEITGEVTSESIKVLKEAVNLESLKLYNVRDKVLDIEPIRNLKKLKELDITSTQISDTNIIKGLTELEHLKLMGNNLTDISFIGELKNLKELNLMNNDIEDISAISNLDKLKSLTLSGNNVTDLSVLEKMTSIDNLIANNNGITDIGALKNLKKLRLLCLDYNNITDISVLENIDRLVIIILNDNNISDISPLKQYSKLLGLNIDNNPLWEDDGNNKKIGSVDGKFITEDKEYEIWTDSTMTSEVSPWDLSDHQKNTGEREFSWVFEGEDADDDIVPSDEEQVVPNITDSSYIGKENDGKQKESKSTLPIIATTIGGLVVLLFTVMNSMNLKIYAVENLEETLKEREIDKRKIKIHSDEITVDISKELARVNDGEMKIVFGKLLINKLLNKKVIIANDKEVLGEVEITKEDLDKAILVTKDKKVTLVKK